MVRDPDQPPSSNGHHPSGRLRSGKPEGPRPIYMALSSDMGFVPRGQPLPLATAIRSLPGRYRFVLSKPGFVEPFAAEMGLAEWKIVWCQLLIYTVIATLCGLLRTLFTPVQANPGTSGSGLSSTTVLQALNLSSSLGLLLFIPLLFFGAMGLLYGLARAFGGHGVFVQQAYTTLLFVTPCGILVSVLGLLPFVGSFLSTFLGVVLFVYCVILECFATVAIHQISGGKATAASVITTLMLFPATLLGLGLWAFLFVTLFHI
jgi:hypothetical protein